MKKYYKANVNIFYNQNNLYNNIYEETNEIIVEEISKNRKYREFVTGYPIKAIYLYPVTIKEIIHDALLNIGDPEKYVDDEINKNKIAILFSLDSISNDNMNNHLYEVKNHNELSSYIDNFSNSKFYEVYKTIMDNNKVKVKK